MAKHSIQTRSTQDKILDAAEALFAKKGFNGVTIRDVTEFAGVNLNLARHHFGNKEDLFESVIKRRTLEVNTKRIDALMRLKDAGTVTLEKLMSAFMEPYLRSIVDRDPGWLNYGRLIAHVALDEERERLENRDLSNAASLYCKEIAAITPGASLSIVSQGFVFAFSMMVMITASRRWDSIVIKNQRTNLKNAYSELIPFMVGGMQAIIEREIITKKNRMTKRISSE